MNSKGNDFTGKYGSFQEHYTETGFWAKLKKHAGRLGKQGLEHALVLYYALQEPSVPTWAKAVIVGALGYFIFPLDAIPDFIPALGMVDDISVLVAAIVTLELNIPESARLKAKAKIKEWFGE